MKREVGTGGEAGLRQKERKREEEWLQVFTLRSNCCH